MVSSAGVNLLGSLLKSTSIGVGSKDCSLCEPASTLFVETVGASVAETSRVAILCSSAMLPSA